MFIDTNQLYFADIPSCEIVVLYESCYLIG